MIDYNNDQPPMPGIYPDYAAPVVLCGAAGLKMRDMRWGTPSSKKAVRGMALPPVSVYRAKGIGVLHLRLS